MNLTWTAKYKSFVHLRIVVKYLEVREVILQESRKVAYTDPTTPGPPPPHPLLDHLSGVLFMCETRQKKT